MVILSSEDYFEFSKTYHYWKKERVLSGTTACGDTEYAIVKKIG
jgi:hypothetical protein